MSNRNTIRITALGSPEQRFVSAEDALEHTVCGDRLRDAITQITFVDRAI